MYMKIKMYIKKLNKSTLTLSPKYFHSEKFTFSTSPKVFAAKLPETEY